MKTMGALRKRTQFHSFEILHTTIRVQGLQSHFYIKNLYMEMLILIVGGRNCDRSIRGSSEERKRLTQTYKAVWEL